MIIAESNCVGVGTTKISLVVDESIPSLFEKRRISISREVFGGEKTTFTIGLDKSGAENMLQFLKKEFPELFTTPAQAPQNGPVKPGKPGVVPKCDPCTATSYRPHPEPPEPPLRWYDDVS